MTSHTPGTDATAAPIQAPAPFPRRRPNSWQQQRIPWPTLAFAQTRPPHSVRTRPRKKYPASFPRATTDTYHLYHPSTLRRSQNHNGESPTPLDPPRSPIPNHTSRGAHPSLRRHGACMATANRSASDEGTQTEFCGTNTYTHTRSSTHHIHAYIRALPLRTCCTHTHCSETHGKQWILTPSRPPPTTAKPSSSSTSAATAAWIAPPWEISSGRAGRILRWRRLRIWSGAWAQTVRFSSLPSLTPISSTITLHPPHPHEHTS